MFILCQMFYKTHDWYTWREKNINLRNVQETINHEFIYKKEYENESNFRIEKMSKQKTKPINSKQNTAE